MMINNLFKMKVIVLLLALIALSLAQSEALIACIE